MEDALDIVTGGLIGAVSLAMYSFYAKQKTVKKLKTAMIEAAQQGKTKLPCLPKPACRNCTPTPTPTKTPTGWVEASEAVAAEVQKSIKAAIEAEPEQVRESLHHSFRAPGKMIRSRLVGLLWAGMNSPAHSPQPLHRAIIDLCALVELEHTASLLHDDVVDEAATRRGEKSHCAKFGSRKSVLHGDYLVAMVVDRLSKIGDPEITRVIAQSMLELVRGELLQVADISGEPGNFTQYMEKSFCKTAALFVAVIESFARLGNKNLASFRRVGVCVGLAFQLVDDCLDFEASEEELGKPGQGSDLTHGHITAPVLLADSHVQQAVRQDVRVDEAVKLVKQGGGIARTRSLADCCIANAIISAVERPRSPARATS